MKTYVEAKLEVDEGNDENNDWIPFWKKKGKFIKSILILIEWF